jgi:hypothetical protein
MPPDEQAVRDADARFAEWMTMNLDRAARRFGLAVTGTPVPDAAFPSGEK